MMLERRTEGASDRDQDRHQDRQPATSPLEPTPSEPARLESIDDPFRGMSDGDVLQRLEWL